jgi:hypothetical protein
MCNAHIKQQHPLQKPLTKKACMKCGQKLDMQILDQNVTWLLEELTKPETSKGNIMMLQISEHQAL